MGVSILGITTDASVQTEKGHGKHTLPAIPVLGPNESLSDEAIDTDSRMDGAFRVLNLTYSSLRTRSYYGGWIGLAKISFWVFRCFFDGYLCYASASYSLAHLARLTRSRPLTHRDSIIGSCASPSLPNHFYLFQSLEGGSTSRHLYSQMVGTGCFRCPISCRSLSRRSAPFSRIVSLSNRTLTTCVASMAVKQTLLVWRESSMSSIVSWVTLPSEWYGETPDAVPKARAFCLLADSESAYQNHLSVDHLFCR